jgi:hypothetical protein
MRGRWPHSNAVRRITEQVAELQKVRGSFERPVTFSLAGYTAAQSPQSING